MSKSKNIIIGALLVAIVAMSVGYAALAQQLTINGTANIKGSWDVEFTKIEEGTLTGATTVGIPAYTATTATFEVDLSYPGATATYDITIENKGNIDAVLDSIVGVDTANGADPAEIQYSVTGIAASDDLAAGASTVAHVTVTWVASADNSDTIPEETTKTATITLNYVQKTA